MREAVGGEIRIEVGEARDQRPRQNGHVARRRDLSRVWQAGGVAERRRGHAELACLLRHHRSELALCPAEGLGDDDRHVVGGMDDQRQDGLLHRDLLSLGEAKVRGRLLGGMGGDGQLIIELELLGLDGLEQQVERHHLRERRRIGAGLGVGLVENRAAVGIDDDRGRGRLGFDARRRHIEDGRDRDEHNSPESESLRNPPLVIKHVGSSPCPRVLCYG
jgi:hypothetical protein